eukprot:GHVR01167205.1.p1 GENE.GHVR01167205.1~~GHVR01167205.1.p1  ORF type:complete len:229 (+),score=62.17 GHVR01167205.1:37-723(+)
MQFISICLVAIAGVAYGADPLELTAETGKAGFDVPALKEDGCVGVLVYAYNAVATFTLKEDAKDVATIKVDMQGKEKSGTVDSKDADPKETEKDGIKFKVSEDKVSYTWDPAAAPKVVGTDKLAKGEKLKLFVDDYKGEPFTFDVFTWPKGSDDKCGVADGDAKKAEEAVKEEKEVGEYFFGTRGEMKSMLYMKGAWNGMVSKAEYNLKVYKNDADPKYLASPNFQVQ